MLGTYASEVFACTESTSSRIGYCYGKGEVDLALRYLQSLAIHALATVERQDPEFTANGYIDFATCAGILRLSAHYPEFAPYVDDSVNELSPRIITRHAPELIDLLQSLKANPRPSVLVVAPVSMAIEPQIISEQAAMSRIEQAAMSLVELPMSLVELPMVPVEAPIVELPITLPLLPVTPPLPPIPTTTTGVPIVDGRSQQITCPDGTVVSGGRRCSTPAPIQRGSFAFTPGVKLALGLTVATALASLLGVAVVKRRRRRATP